MLEIKNIRTAATLELDVDAETLQPQDSGSREAAAVEFDLYDQLLTFDLLPEDEITVSSVSDPTDLLFGGFVRLLTTDIFTVGRVYHVTAYDYSTLLDRINVVEDDRVAGESDHDRLVYFMTTYGSGLLSPSGADIATLNGSMPAQRFRVVTLRQAIEQVLGTALETGAYRLNSEKRLQTWDSDPGLTAAPFDIVVGTPGGGEIAPETLSLKADTSNLFNAYWVRGATAAGSGWFTDAASIAQWGRREKYIDAPDSDLAWKAYNVGHAALADTAQPIYRGTFTVHEGDWRSEQRFALTSAQHGLSAAPFDTSRVSRRYLTGEAIEAFDVEFGSPKASFAAKHGKETRRSDGVGGGGGGGTGIGGDGGTGTDSSSCADCCCPDPWYAGSCQGDCSEGFDRAPVTGLGTSELFGAPVWQSSGTATIAGSEAVLPYGTDPYLALTMGTATEILIKQRIERGTTANSSMSVNPASPAATDHDVAARFTLLPTVITQLGVRYASVGLLMDHGNHGGVLSTDLQVELGWADGVSGARTTAIAASGVSSGVTVWTRIRIDPAGTTGSTLKVNAWLDGSSEPAWLLTSAADWPDGGGLPIPIQPNLLVLDNRVGADETTWNVDSICFIAGIGCGPSDGAPVDNEDHGLGDGSTTSYATTFAYKVGSAVGKIDHIEQTVTATDGANVVFGRAPETDEQVTISYVKSS